MCHLGRGRLSVRDLESRPEHTGNWFFSHHLRDGVDKLRVCIPNINAAVHAQYRCLAFTDLFQLLRSGRFFRAAGNGQYGRVVSTVYPAEVPRGPPSFVHVRSKV